jgi:hypothetical protein
LNSNIDIVIAGYPKSGTHWISHLVKDLINADHVLDLTSSDDLEVTTDAIDRCWKTHLTYPEIVQAFKGRNFKLINVTRDPRDVAISGSYFFPFVNPKVRAFFRIIPGGDFVYDRIKWWLSSRLSIEYKRALMIAAVLHGDRRINEWCEISWKSYVRSFFGSDALGLKYEDMLDKPEEECRKIRAFVARDWSDTEIAQSGEKFSFKNQKPIQKFGYTVLRKGERGYWKNEMDQAQVADFEIFMGEEMEAFGYELSEHSNT